MFGGSYRITLKDGVAIRLFVAPSLYAVSKERDIDIVSPISNEPIEVIKRYASIAYCAAINAWEIDKVDDLGKGDFPYSFGDFVEWAYANEDAFLAFIDFATKTITGKGIKEYQAEKEVKKKTSFFRRIFSR